jgi:hypothetical protein
MVPSSEALAMRAPSGLKATDLTGAEWPRGTVGVGWVGGGLGDSGARRFLPVGKGGPEQAGSHKRLRFQLAGPEGGSIQHRVG